MRIALSGWASSDLIASAITAMTLSLNIQSD
jgi:hypothetical protein